MQLEILILIQLGSTIRESLESREEKLSFMSLMRTERLCFKLSLIILREIFSIKKEFFLVVFN